MEINFLLFAIHVAAMNNSYGSDSTSICVASHSKSTVMSKTTKLINIIPNQYFLTVLGNFDLLQHEAQLHCADLS